MKRRLWICVLNLPLWVSLLALCACGPTPATRVKGSPLPLYRLHAIIPLPHFTAATCYDIAEFANGALYLGDATNQAIDVVRGTHLSQMGQGRFTGEAGCTHFDFTRQGPSGVLVEHHHLWASDGDATIKVFDLASGHWLATIPTGKATENRADEMAYIAATNQVVVANPEATPTPFLSYIDASSLKVVHRQLFADATAGLEQPRYSNGWLFQAVPATHLYPGGEIDVINPSTYAIVGRYETPGCSPNGLALDHFDAVVGCGNGPGEILHLQTDTVSTVVGSSASDMVAVDEQRGHFFFASVPGATVFVTDTAGHILQKIPTDPRAHSVAVDPANGDLYIPRGKAGGIAEYVLS